MTDHFHSLAVQEEDEGGKTLVDVHVFSSSFLPLCMKSDDDIFAEIYPEPFHTKLIAIIHPNPLPKRIWRISVLTHRCCFYSIYVYFLFFLLLSSE